MTRASRLSSILSPDNRVQVPVGGVPDPAGDSEYEVLTLVNQGGQLVPDWLPNAGGGGGGTDVALRQTPLNAVSPLYWDNWRGFVGSALGFESTPYDSEFRRAFGLTPTSNDSDINAAVNNRITGIGRTLYTGSTFSVPNQFPTGITILPNGQIRLQYSTSLTAVGTWSQSNSNSKAAWFNQRNNEPNNSNIILRAQLSGGATFATNDSDYVIIAGQRINGPFPTLNASANNIITFMQEQFPANAQIASTVLLSGRFTSDTGQQLFFSNYEMYNTPATAFSISNLTAYFTYQGPGPAAVPFYLTAYNNFYWNYTTNGTVLTGSASYSDGNSTSALDINSRGNMISGNYNVSNTYTLRLSLQGNGLNGAGAGFDSETTIITEPSGANIFNPWFFGTAASEPANVTDLVNMDGGHQRALTANEVASFASAPSVNSVFLAIVSTASLTYIEVLGFRQDVPTPTTIDINVPGAIGGQRFYKVYNFGQVGSSPGATYTLTFQGSF